MKMCVRMPLEIVEYFHRQGVTLKVFSGDNPFTVAAAAKTAGMDTSAGAVDASTLPEDGSRAR